MKDEATLLDPETLTIEQMDKFVQGYRERRDNPSVQDQLFNLVGKAVGLLDPYKDPEFMRDLAVSKRLSKIEKKLAEIKPPKKTEKAPRAEQLAKARCQTAAKLLWKANPHLTITAVAKHESVCSPEITGGGTYVFSTIRDWVSEVYPKSEKPKVGRPRKQPVSSQ